MLTPVSFTRMSPGSLRSRQVTYRSPAEPERFSSSQNQTGQNQLRGTSRQASPSRRPQTSIGARAIRR